MPMVPLRSVLALLVLVGACRRSEANDPRQLMPYTPPAKASTPSPAPAPVPSHPSASPTASVAHGSADRQLLAAAEAYVRANAAPEAAFELAVVVQQGDFAQVAATRKDDDGAMVFLKKQDGTWRGVTLGSSVPCDELSALGFPAAVSRGCD